MAVDEMGDEQGVKNEALEIMGVFQLLPRLVVFDLDYTLWPFYWYLLCLFNFCYLMLLVNLSSCSSTQVSKFLNFKSDGYHCVLVYMDDCKTLGLALALPNIGLNFHQCGLVSGKLEITT